MTDDERQAVDGQTLLDDLEIDSDEIESRKRLAQFDDADANRLAEMGPMFDEIEDDVLDEFYAQLQAHTETSEIFDQSSRPIRQLKQLQAEYLQRLGCGTYDESYFAQRARVGKIHDMIGLEPKMYLGSYSLYYEQILDGITSSVVDETVSRHDEETIDRETFESELETAAAEIEARTLSVLKLLLLDKQLAIDTYIQSYSEVEDEIERQQEVATDIRRSVNQLENGANVVEHSAREINDITDTQVEAVQEVSSEVSDLSATVEEIASSAEEVNATSEEAEKLSQTATDSAQDAIEKIEGLEEAASTVSDDVNQLRDSVMEIDELVEVIDDIADQTNLLALNASIEAANAGSSGDGFAVVANEVKSLAEESQEQADTIKRTIDGIQADTDDTVESLEVATDYVSQASDEVRDNVERLEQITDAVGEASSGIEEVAEATDDQAASTEEVASMIDQIADDIETISDRIDDVVTVVGEQTERTEQIDEALDRLSTDR